MPTYLITQATGNQSQWTIKHLLRTGAKVHAIVRDPQKVPAVLQDPAVTIFKGESTNFEEVFQAAQGCQAVFLNTFPIPGLEAQQAKTIVEACRKAGLKSVVASTTFWTGNKAMWSDEVTEKYDMLGYYVSKNEVEDVVRGAGFDAYTILRPAWLHVDYFLPNAHANFPRLPTHGELDHAYDDGVRMPHTDASDVGRIAAMALQDPAKFGGHEIEICSDNLTVEEARDILVKITGRDVRVKKRTPEEVEELKATLFSQRFQLWANVKDLSGSLEAAKEVEAKLGIKFTPIDAALRRDKDRLLECLPASA